MKPIRTLLVPLAATLLAAPLSARTWTDAATGRTIEADFLGIQDGKVSLKRSDGQTFTLPIDKISAADQDFIKQQKAGPASAPAAAGTDWPGWRGPNRNDHSPDTGLLKSWPEKGPELLWSFENGGKGYSSPAIVGDRIYFTGSRKGSALVICLDASSGKELWNAPIGDDSGEGYNTGWGSGPRGAPTVSDGLVFALTANGELGCLSAADGKRQWRKNFVDDLGGKVPSWGYAESPLVDGDKLIVTPGGKDGAIVAFDKKTGKQLWRSEDLHDDAQYASIVIVEAGGKRQYVQLFMKNVAGIDAETGELLWTAPWKDGRTAVIPTPVVNGDQVYITSGYGAGSMLLQVAADSAKELWKNKVMKNHHGGVLLVDDHLYGFSDGGGLTCQSLKTGDRTWNEKGQGIQKGTVHYADGMLYCIDEHEGSVFLIEASPKGFSEQGRFPMPRETELRKGTKGKVWTHPVVLNGRLYLRDQDLFFCYDVSGP